MPAQTFSVAARESSQDGPLAPRLVNLRSRAAVVRMLADEVEQVTRAADAEGLGAQMVEEMARLGCRLLDEAAALAKASPVEESGVFKRGAALETGHWETPTHDLVRMDAEIGSYQEDHGPGREEPPFLEQVTRSELSRRATSTIAHGG